MITAVESLAHIGIAAGISTAMVGRAFVGHPPRAGERRLRVRRLWLAAGAIGAAMSCGVALVDAQVGRDVDPGRVIEILAMLAVGALVAISLTYVGLRGRRVGDHPHCRRCGFDLFGRPDGTLVCSECGALLDAPRAIVIGTRQRRLGPLLAGVFGAIAMLAYATSLAPEILRWSRAADFSSIKPTAWLIDDLWNRNATAYNRASNELGDRASRGKLDRATLDHLVERLLARPFRAPRMPGVDQNATFASYVAEEAWRAGTADEATVRRTMRASFACTLNVAPQASANRTLRYWISIADYRIARDDNDDPALARVNVTNRTDALDGVPLPPPTWSTLRGSSEWPGLEAFGNAFDLRGHATLGPATLTTSCTATLTLAMPGRPTLIETRDVTLAGTTTIVDAAQMTCPPVRQPPPPGATVDRSATQPLATPEPTLRITRTNRTSFRALHVEAPRGGAMLADVSIHGPAVDRSLGTIFVDVNAGADVPIDPLPSGAFTVEFKPVPERGADLFKSPAVFAVPIVVPSSAIEDFTGE